MALAQTDPPKTETPDKATVDSKTAQPVKPVKPAQPTSKPAARTRTVEAVTAVGAAPDTQTSIDKRSYTLGKDLQATTGSIADALRNVPVGGGRPCRGTLSVRGDPNVTILVGRQALLRRSRATIVADALQQLPADQIERVEVITNPSAALNPEGTGGVINLITKQSRGTGLTGSAYL